MRTKSKSETDQLEGQLLAGALDEPLRWELRAGLRRVVAVLTASPFGPHLLFALATVIAIGGVGYRLGTFDQIITLAFLKHAADPALYGADPFIALSAHRYTFFWYLFLPFERLGWLEVVTFIAHVLATYFTFWGVWSLSQALWTNRLVSVLAVAGLTAPHVGLGGFALIEMGLLYRTLVLPFILWALTLVVRRRIVPAFALLGVLYNFHVLSVNFAFGLVLVAALGQLRLLGGWLSLRRLAAGLAIFALCALPVLLWRAHDGGLDLSVRPEWLAVMARDDMNLMMALPGSNPIGPLIAASGLSMAVMFGLAWRGTARSASDRIGGWFMLAALLIVAAGQVFYYFLPLTALLQLQLVRVGIFIQLLGYLYFARYLIQPWPGAPGRVGRWLVVAAYVFMPWAFMVLVVLALVRWRPAARWPRVRAALAVGLALASLVITVAGGLARGYWQPGLYLGAPPTDWSAAQRWVSRNTPKDAQFITPPQMGGMYATGWRVFSERGTVVTLSDLVDVILSPDYLGPWQARFEAVAPGALARFNGDPAHNAAVTAQAFEGLSDAQVLAAARQYGASYLVADNLHRRPWRVVYENPTYIIYDLRPAL